MDHSEFNDFKTRYLVLGTFLHQPVGWLVRAYRGINTKGSMLVLRPLTIDIVHSHLVSARGVPYW